MTHSLLYALLSYQYPKLTMRDYENLCLERGLLPEKLCYFFRAFPSWRQRAKDDLQRLRSLKAKITYPGLKDYPLAFQTMEWPPMILSYWGQPVWEKHQGLAVVGSREPTRGSEEWLENYLPNFLSKRDLFTVSGGARGIDQRVHAISLRCQIPTVAFLPSGLGKLYPKDFASWVDSIVAGGGAVVSEFAPYQRMYRSHFQRRNRLIAGLAKLSVVVEAKRKSGSAMTGRIAVDLGRELSVLPGFPMDENFQGCLDLLFDGASMIRNDSDLLSLWDRTKPLQPFSETMP